MSEENIFYVYEHWRPDTGVCFYVGKGKNKRAWDMSNMRNPHFKAVVSKLTSLGLCVDVRIIAKNLEEKTAFSMEIERIAMYGVDSLTNMTGGGDGLVMPSQETRDKMSKSQKLRFENSPEERLKVSLRSKGKNPSEETRKKLSISGTGRKHTPETIEKMKVSAKIRGISDVVREAQKLAVTGKKRLPFKESTIIKMKAAAKAREAAKKAACKKAA